MRDPRSLDEAPVGVKSSLQAVAQDVTRQAGVQLNTIADDVARLRADLEMGLKAIGSPRGGSKKKAATGVFMELASLNSAVEDLGSRVAGMEETVKELSSLVVRGLENSQREMAGLKKELKKLSNATAESARETSPAKSSKTVTTKLKKKAKTEKTPAKKSSGKRAKNEVEDNNGRSDDSDKEGVGSSQSDSNNVQLQPSHSLQRTSKPQALRSAPSRRRQS